MRRDGNAAVFVIVFYIAFYLYSFICLLPISSDHEYEPINTHDDVDRPQSGGSGDASANASVYEPIQDPNAPAAAQADENTAPAATDGTTIGPRRKSFIDSAGDRTRQIRASISSQAGALRTKLQNLKRPARSASREEVTDKAVGDDEAEPPADAQDADADVHMDDAADEAVPAKEPKKSRAALAKLKSVQMPKLRKPQFKRPEFTKKLKAPEFKMRMPERPAFTRAENYSFRFRKQASAPETDAAAGDGMQTQRSASEEPPQRKQRSPKAGKTKRFDFGTYPRIFQRLRKQSQPETSGGTDFSTTASVSRGNDSQDTQETGDGGRQRKLGPITFGTFPRMGRRSILTTSTERSDSAQDTSSVRTDQFEPMRDESVERRLTERLQQAMAASNGELGAGESLAGSLAVDVVEPTAEQKQLAEYDEENREIHQISKAREGEFRQRRPKLKHQESDLTSEAESTRGEPAWESAGPTSGLGRLKTRMEEEWDRTTHGHDEEAEPDLALVQQDVDVPADFHPVQMDTDRLSTQETQSSGSSGYLRRKGVIEDHEDVDRHTDYSHSDHDLRFESESAILGGSKASTDRMDTFYGDRQQADSFDSADKYKPTAPGRRHRHHRDGEEPEVDDLSDSLRHSRHFDEYPDDEPVDEKVADLQAKVDEYEDEFERLFYKHQQHLEDYRLQRGDDRPAEEEEDDGLDGMQNIIMASLERTSGTPPVAPRRRKRKSMERPSGRPELAFGREKSETPRSDRGGVAVSHDVRFMIACFV